MSAISALFPPDYALRRRGWEAAYTLVSEFPDRLDPAQRHIVRWIAARRPERLGWEDIGMALRIYRLVVEIRV